MNSMKKLNYKTRLQNIKAFVLDVDGVLSDGTVQLDASGEMTRNMNVRDGLAIRLALEAGFKIVIISAGTSLKVVDRLNYLGVCDVFMSIENKLDCLNTYLKDKNIMYEHVLYMGDDFPDAQCLRKVGVSTCPQDAMHEIRNLVDYISHVEGGKGAVRDVIEQTLRVQNHWPSV